MTKTLTNKVKHYTAPLALYVVWHPDFLDGAKFAEKIFSLFCRNLQTPLGRSTNIPVFFRSKENPKTGVPIDIKFKEADKNAILLLVDDEMFGSDKWSGYIQGLLNKSNKNIRFFPVAFSEYAYHLNKDLSKIQFVKAKDIKGDYEEDTFNKQWNLLKSRLLHGIARQLLNVSDYYEVDNTDDPPVQLFLSHAKNDGENIAKSFRDYIESNTKLNTFFDTNDIADGHDFEHEIEKGLKDSAVIIFNTDEYSTREWCRREVIIAKRFRCPILCVVDLKKGEVRSFPYMGNVPTIVWNSRNMEEIINQTLLEVISQKYSLSLLEKTIILNELDKSKYLILSKAPEIFNYIDIEKFREDNSDEIVVLYPEPPLGFEEIRLLNDVNNKITFTTPVQLPLS